MSRVVKVPSGAIFDLDRAIMILKDSSKIGEYGVLMAAPHDIVPNIDGNDVDALVRAGLIQEVK